MNAIEKVRREITRGKTERALKLIMDLPELQRDDDRVNTVTLLTGQYSRDKQNAAIGILDPKDFSRTTTRINLALLSMLDELEEEDEFPDMAPPPPDDDFITTAPPPPDDGPRGPAAPAAPPAPEPTAPTVPRPTAEETKILFLAANPYQTAKLQLRTEHSHIVGRLSNAADPDQFPIKLFQAVTVAAFQEQLLNERPDIVHFSGHGDLEDEQVKKMIQQRGAGRDAVRKPQEIEKEAGVYLLGPDLRDAQFVTSSVLKRIFRTMLKRRNIPIKAVVFNACHSGDQAAAVSEVVPYVVGTTASVGDDAAIAFASGFYLGIAQGIDIPGAVDLGINEAMAFNEPEDRFLLYKNGDKVSL